MFFSILSHSFFNGTQISFPYIVVAHLSNSNNDGDNDIAKRVISPLSPRESKSEKPSGTRDVSQDQNESVPYKPVAMAADVSRVHNRTSEECLYIDAAK